MATKYYLEVSDLKGSSEAIGLVGAFEVKSYFLNAEALSAGSGGSGGGAGKPDFSPLILSFSDETELTGFLAKAASGQLSALASLTGRDPTNGNIDVFRINLADVFVSRVLEGDFGGFIVELTYGQIGVLTRDQKPDGTFTALEGFGYDVAAAQIIPPPANASPPGGNEATGASRFFLMIDGVSGGSTDIGHAGWFDMARFDFDVEAMISLISGGGAAAGVTDFGPLNADLPNLGGLVALLGKLATGGALPGVRIEGTSSDGTVFYRLDLADVFVKSVADIGFDGYATSFEYGRIKLTTFTQDEKGAPGPSQTFTWNVATNSADIGVLPVIAPAATNVSPPGGADDFYLEVAGLSGPTQLIGLEGAFEIEAFRFAAQNTGDFVGGAGGGAGKAQFESLFLRFADESGLSAFLDLAASGQHVAGVSLTGVRDAPGHPEVYRLNLADVIVTSVNDTGGDGYVVQLAYAEVGVITRGQKPDGTTAPPETFGFDIVGNVTGPPPPDAVAGPSVGGTAPDSYFLLVDGVNGGSTDAKHAGWFELDTAFTFDVEALIGAIGGGAGAGKAVFSDFSVHVPNLAGLTSLLGKLATGAALPGIRLEGVTSLGDVTYRLNLADVHVASIRESRSGGYDIAFDYHRIALTLFSQDDKGVLQPGEPFTFNRLTQTGDIGALPTLTVPPGSAGAPGEGDAFFLEVSGLSGSATAIGVEGAFEVLNYDFGANNPTDFADAGGGIGKANFSSLQVYIATENGLAEFLKMLATGQFVEAASLTGRRTSEGSVEVFRVNLANVVVTEVNEVDEHGYQVTLQYGAIGVETRAQKPDGTFDAPTSFGFDLTTNQTIPVPPDAVPGPVVGSAGAQDYLLLIDGIQGDSNLARHVGWFDLSSFGLDVEGLTSIGSPGGGAGAGKPDFGPLTVRLGGFTGLPELLKALATGQHIEGLRIEGLVGTGQRSYLLDLADVTVVSIREDDLGGFEVAFDYGRIRLTTFTQKPDGTFQPGAVFSWNIPVNSTDVGTLPDISPIGGPNHPPVATPDTVAVNEDATSGNLWTTLLGNDTDPDVGDVRTIVGVTTTSTKGAVVFDPATQTLTYSANHDDFDLLATGAVVQDSFSYTIQDGGGLTATTTVTVSVTGVGDGGTVVGDNGTDSITGTAGEDSIKSGNGSDQIAGGDGADTVNGENGEDVILGGGGHDQLRGENGGDDLRGGAGDDQLFGGNGSDTLQGDEGSDRLIGGQGPDVLVFFLGGAPNPADVDQIVDFGQGDKVRFAGGSAITSTSVTDFNGDGAADTVHVLVGGQKLVLLSYTGWNSGDFIIG